VLLAQADTGTKMVHLGKNTRPFFAICSHLQGTPPGMIGPHVMIPGQRSFPKVSQLDIPRTRDPHVHCGGDTPDSIEHFVDARKHILEQVQRSRGISWQC